MNKINCPECGLATWATAETCVRCKFQFSPDAEAIPHIEDNTSKRVSRPLLATQPSGGSPKYLSAVAAIVVAVLVVGGVFYSTQFYRAAPVKTDKSVATANTSEETEDTPESQDAGHWGVAEPPLDRLLVDEHKRWENTTSAQYQMPAYHYLNNPMAVGYCRGYINDPRVKDYEFMEVDGEKRMRLTIEGEVYSGRVEDRKCQEPAPNGVLSTEAWYIWKESGTNAMSWVRRSDDDDTRESDHKKMEEERVADSKKDYEEFQKKEAKRRQRQEQRRFTREFERLTQTEN